MAFKVVRACISIVASSAIYYILYATFGTSMEVLRQNFLALIPHIKLSTGWAAIATTSANNFNYLFDAIWVFGVATIIYFILSGFTNQDVDRFAQ